jgi:hypothetical protein
MLTIRELLLCGSVAFAAPAWAQVSADAEEQAGGVQMMLVQSAREMTFDGELLTLKGLPPSTLFFADRPERIVGHMTNEELLAAWSDGKDRFSQDPPNAALSVLGEGGPQVAIIELQEPRLEGDDIVYRVRVLEGEPPSSAGATALFVDPWYWRPSRWGPPGPGWGMGPAWRDCHWSWYWDRRVCRW